MNSKLWIRKALSSCLCAAVLMTYSMAALAAPGKVSGELTVFGNTDESSSFVVVNGEAARSGRTIFSSSTITTPESASAVINVGKVGKFELAPASAVVVSFDENGINADLTAGKLTVLGSAGSFNVKTAAGETVELNTGESTTAAGKKQDDDTTSSGGAAWVMWAVVFAGAAAGIIYTATQSDNNINLGGGGTVISPVR